MYSAHLAVLGQIPTTAPAPKFSIGQAVMVCVDMQACSQTVVADIKRRMIRDIF